MIKAVLFDFDGTIMDTSELIIGSWQHVFRTLTGKDGDLEEIKKSFGETLWFTMEKFFPDRNADKCVDIYREWQKDKYLDEIELFPGIAVLIRWLASQDVKLAIVTSRARKSLELGLEKFNLQNMFQVLVTCEDTDAHKPSPIPAQIALKQLGVKPEEALFIGDTKFDIGCANNAGIPSVLVGWATETEERTENVYKPTYKVETTREIMKIVEKINNK